MIRSTKRWRIPALLALGGLTAGAAVMTAGSAQALPEFAITRIAGPDRAATAAAIAVDTFDTADTAIIVRDNEFADALAGNYLAGQLNAPILLTGTNAVPSSTLTALDTLGVDNVRILGGTTAVSDAVVAALGTTGVTVERTAGTDRFDTAARVAVGGSLLPGNVGTINGERTAVVSSGRNFPDALSAGPVVYSEHLPQLLTEVNSLPAATLNALQTLEIDRVILTGGTTAVSETVRNQIAGAGITVQRIAGATRYDTSLQLAIFAGQVFGYEADHLNFATGVNFPDALAGGPHGGEEERAILLTPNVASGAEFTFVCDALEALQSELVTAHVFGGTGAVPDAVVDALETCGQGTTPAGGTGQVTAVDTASGTGGTYTFVQTSDNAVRTITYENADTFNVDNAVSNVAGFEDADPDDGISVGDTITVSPDGNTHSLTNVTVTSGLVGNVNITDGVGGNTFAIVNPVTGTVVGGPFTYDIATDDFGTQTPAQFENDINEGDTIAITEVGNPAVTTYTLTNATLTGVVTASAVVPAIAAFTLKGAFGDLYDAGGGLDTAFIASAPPSSGTENFTVDADAAATFTDFRDALSNGDTVAYSRAGGEELFVLTTGAPPAITGVAFEITPGSDQLTILVADGLDVGTALDELTVSYAIGNVTVDANTNAGPAEVEAAFSPGDAVVYQPADADSSTAESLKLTNATLKGTLTDVDGALDTYDVLASDGVTVLVDDLPYAGDLYRVNGSVVAVGPFETAILAHDANDTIEFTGTEHIFVAVANP